MSQEIIEEEVYVEVPKELKSFMRVSAEDDSVLEKVVEIDRSEEVTRIKQAIFNATSEIERQTAYKLEMEIELAKYE